MRPISEDSIKNKIKLLNPHWESGDVESDLRKDKKRKYFDLFYPLVISKVQRAVILMGPRRVGKTVVLWQTIQTLLESGKSPEKILYLSLDVPLLHPYSLEQLLDLYKEIFKLNNLKGTVIMFDEIQYLKNWDVQLKVLVDTHKKTKFIASGSAASALKRKSDESGAGRFTDFMLPALTFYEYLDLLNLTDLVKKDIKKLNQQFINYLNYGGFPEAIFSKEIQKNPKRFIRGDIIDKVLLRDLPSLYGIQDTQELNRLFNALAYQTGNEVTYEGLSKASGIAKNTIKRYIEYLEAAFLIRTIKRVDDSGKRFKRTNYFKVYLTNPSMYPAIYGLVSEEDTETIGHLVETAIFSQWGHSPDSMDLVYYARWKGGKGEVDLVVAPNNLPLYCLEVKWSDRSVDRPEELKSLLHFCKQNNLTEALVTTKTMKSQRQYGGITFNFEPSSAFCYMIGHNVIAMKSKGKQKKTPSNITK